MKKRAKNTLLIIFLLIVITLPIKAEAEIEFWTINLSPKFDEYFLIKISEYEENNPDIKIVWEDINFSSINQQLRYRIAEGDVPEVVNLSPQLMAPLLEAGLLFPISTLEKNYSDNYFPLIWENGFYQGKYYAFPWYLSSRLMAYNQEIFKIAGLNPAEPPETKAELFKISEEITEKTGVYGLMPQIKILHEFIEAGIKILKEEDNQLRAAFNTPEALELIERYQKLAAEGVIPADALSSGFNVALERYLENDLAILFTAPQFLKEIDADSEYLKENTALAVIPAAEEGVINAALMNLVIPAAADNKEEAAEFAHFITSPESQQEFSQLAAVLPSAVSNLNEEDENNELQNEKRKIIVETEVSASLEEQAREILMEQLPKNQDLTLIHPEASKLLKIMDEQFARAFASKISAAEALKQMESGWNEILSNNRGDK